jgi:hypothetical protein
MQHTNKAVDEVRRAEFFRKGGRMRSLVKGKRWPLLARWVHLTTDKRQQLNQAVRSQPESLEGLPVQRKTGAAVDIRLTRARCCLSEELDPQLRWLRLPALEKLAHM